MTTTDRVDGTRNANNANAGADLEGFYVLNARADGAPRIDTSRLTPQQRATYDHLISLRDEAFHWSIPRNADVTQLESVDRMVTLIDRAITALGRGEDATALEREATQVLTDYVAQHTPASVTAGANAVPTVDVNALPADIRPLWDAIAANRAQLATFLASPEVQARPDIKRRLTLMVAELDMALANIVDAREENGTYNTDFVEYARQVATDVVQRRCPEIERDLARPAPAVEVEVGGAGTAPVQPGVPGNTRDEVETRPGGTRPGGTTAPVVPSTRDADQDAELAAIRNQLEREETRRAEEARRPGYGTAVLEGTEFAARALPVIGNIVNLISAIINGLRLLWMIIVTIGEWISGKEEKTYDWKDFANVTLRLGTDIAGYFVPLAGAIGDQAADFLFNESRVLGVATGQENLLRSGLSQGADWVSSRWNEVSNAFTGDRTPSNGAVDYRPAVASTTMS